MQQIGRRGGGGGREKEGSLGRIGNRLFGENVGWGGQKREREKCTWGPCCGENGS